MKKMFVNPEWPGRAVGVAVFILAVFQMLFYIIRMMGGESLIDKALALLALPAILLVALIVALIAWECTTRLIARLEFSDEEYQRFVTFRSLRW